RDRARRHRARVRLLRGGRAHRAHLARGRLPDERDPLDVRVGVGLERCMSNRRGVRRPRPPRDPRGDPTGLLLLGVLAVGWLGIPFLAMVVDNETLGAVIVMVATWGPLFWLLAFRGARTDREPGR